MAKVFSVNTLPATGGEAMFIVKTVGVAAGWVVTRSGDGLALYSSSGDILTTGLSGAGGLGNANAWFEMQDAAARVCFTFQRITGVAWRVKYTETGAFAGGTPGISRTGTATDEVVLFGAGTDAAPTGAQMLHTDGGTYRFAVVFQSTPQPSNGTYEFWFGCYPSFSGNTISLFALDGMLAGTYHPLDTAPRAIITWYGTPAIIGWTSSSDVNLYTRAWALYGMVGASIRRYAMGNYTLATNVGSGTSPCGGLGADYMNLNTYAAADQPLPILVGRTIAHGSNPGPKGIFADFKQMTASRQYPQTLNLNTDAYVYWGGLVLPWPENTAGAY